MGSVLHPYRRFSAQRSDSSGLFNDVRQHSESPFNGWGLSEDLCLHEPIDPFRCIGQIQRTVGVLALLIAVLLSGCSSPSNDEAVAQYRAQAQALVENQQFLEALRAYQQVVQRNPGDADAYYQIARLYLRLGKPDDVQQAHQALLKVVKLNKSHLVRTGNWHASPLLQSSLNKRNSTPMPSWPPIRSMRKGMCF